MLRMTSWQLDPVQTPYTIIYQIPSHYETEQRITEKHWPSNHHGLNALQIYNDIWLFPHRASNKIPQKK